MTQENELKAQSPDLNAVLRGRTEILETRFAVAAVQIVERMKIRANNLQKILEEDLEIGGRRSHFGPGNLLPTSPFHELDNKLRDQQSGLDRERRSEEKETWRDLTTTIRDLMHAWEGLSQAKAKERFLESIPNPEASQAYDIPVPARYSQNE